MSLLSNLNPLNWIGNAIDAVAAPVKEWQKRKTLKVEHEFELEKIKHQAALERAQRGEIQDFTLDQIAMKNMEKSWKDELILIIFLTPVVMAFAGYEEVVERGFQAIEKMPDWYMWLLIGMIVVIYGMRGLFMKFASSKIKGL